MSERRNDPGYELRDVNPRLPLYVALGVLILLPLVFLFITGAFALRGEIALSTRVEDFFEGVLSEPRTARLQASPDADLARMRAISKEGLNGYGWIDREAGIVRIPIERAMDLYVQRHGREDSDD